MHVKPHPNYAKNYNFYIGVVKMSVLEGKPLL